MDYEDHVFKEAVNHTVRVFTVSNRYIVEETILVIFSLLAIVADVLLIYTCCYFRKLHTNANIYLINWAIADCGSTLITLTFFTIVNIKIPYKIECFYIALANALLFNGILFMILLTIDWCLSTYLPRLLDAFRKYTNIIVAVAWVVAAVYALLSSFASNYYLIFHISIPIVDFGLLFFVIVLHCIRIVQKLKNRLEPRPIAILVLPTAFVLCGFLNLLDILFLDFSNLYILAETPDFLHSTINLLLFIIFDNDFKLCFFQVIKCHAYPTCNFFKPSTQTESNGSNSGDQPISFDNKTFDSLNTQI